MQTHEPPFDFDSVCDLLNVALDELPPPPKGILCTQFIREPENHDGFCAFVRNDMYASYFRVLRREIAANFNGMADIILVRREGAIRDLADCATRALERSR